MNKQEKKNRKEYHLQQIKEDNPDYDVEYWQKRPNTAARLRYISDTGNSYVFEYFGFAKVCWPDKWNPERGKELALEKAVADIVRDEE